MVEMVLNLFLILTRFFSKIIRRTIQHFGFTIKGFSNAQEKNHLQPLEKHQQSLKHEVKITGEREVSVFLEDADLLHVACCSLLSKVLLTLNLVIN